MKDRSHLRIVPFNPNDYSLGSMLTKENREEIKTPEDISAALSLLFQFPEHALVFLIYSDDEAPVQISLDYDHEERILSELYIKDPDVQSTLPQKMRGNVTVRFEIFRQCYEFESKVLSPFSDGLMVISPPEYLFVIKHRRLPRVAVLPEDHTRLPKCYGLSTDGVKKISFECVELGIKAVRLKGDLNDENNGLLQMGFFCIEGCHIPVKVTRHSKNDAVFALYPRNYVEYGAIFDLYRVLAYPYLRRREEFPSDDVLDLYSDKTGYFGKFQTDSDGAQRKELIKQIWEDIADDRHRITADYVTVDDQGKLAGASSAALAFMKTDRPVWVFHQLCARTSPDLLTQSGELYTWRAEYLAGREENLDIIFWFDSRSRWLERIYVKFVLQNEDVATLIPAAVTRNTFSAEHLPKQINCTNTNYGKSKRTMAFIENTFGGSNPKFLNASGILDAIIAVSERATKDDVVAIAGLLASQAGSSSIDLEVTVPLNKKDLFSSPTVTPLDDVDRFCCFEKQSLIGFIACVEHSVAVTQRKQKHEGYREAG